MQSEPYGSFSFVQLHKTPRSFGPYSPYSLSQTVASLSVRVPAKKIDFGTVLEPSRN